MLERQENWFAMAAVSVLTRLRPGFGPIRRQTNPNGTEVQGMLKTAIIALPDCAAGKITAARDAFWIANKCGERLGLGSALFDAYVTTSDGRRARTVDGSSINAERSCSEFDDAELIVVPRMTLDLRTALDESPEVCAWMKARADEGAIVAIGGRNSIFEETGPESIGRRVAAVPAVMGHLRESHLPGLDAERPMTSYGAKSGTRAPSSGFQFPLYVIGRIHGPELSLMCEQLLSFGRWKGEDPFAPHVDHIAKLPRVQQARQWIADHATEAVNMEALAERVGVVLRELRGHFRELTGETLSAYQRRIRLRLAQHHLEGTNQTVDEITQQVGYADARSFIRLFRAYAGMTPLEYRRRFRQRDKESKLPTLASRIFAHVETAGERWQGRVERDSQPAVEKVTKVAIVMTDDTLANAVLGPRDHLLLANLCGEVEGRMDPFFAPVLVSTDGRPRRAATGQWLAPDQAIEYVLDPDVVVLPPILSAAGEAAACTEDLLAWLRARADHGAVIAFAGRSASIIAKAGLNHACQVADHEADQLILDRGQTIHSRPRVTTSLGMYLIQKYCGKAVTEQCHEVYSFADVRSGQCTLVGLDEAHLDREISAISDWLKEHLSEPIEITSLAAKFGMSARNLGRRFSRATGVAPTEYLRELRLERARTLLIETEDPIADVARRVGYADVRAFARMFARRFGETPGRCRGR